MIVLYEVIKFFFFFYTLLIALFFLKRSDLGLMNSPTIEMGFMVGYLFFCGLIISYIVLQMYANRRLAEKNLLSLYTKGFMWGIVLGILLSMFYIFL